MHMRRLLLLSGLFALLAIPTGASGRWLGGSTDGTLVVRDGYGTIAIGGRDANGNPIGAEGALIGSIEKGRVTLTDPGEGDIGDLKVAGCKTKEVSDVGNSVTCSGSKLRYRVVGGRFRLKIVGDKIAMSVVGRGSVTMNGADVDTDGNPILDDGQYQLNDDDWKSLPDKAKTIPLEG
jgi:hypothetical protein